MFKKIVFLVLISLMFFLVSCEEDNPNKPSISVVATPVFSPPAGSYNSPQNVIISCETSDANIYYTLDNSEPTESSNLYTSAILINENTTIRAKGYKAGFQVSSDTTSFYEILPNTVANPVFSLPAGSYDLPQEILISCETADAEIYYTLDGSTPTDSAILYTAPLEISETRTVKAIAYKDEMDASSVVTAVYEIEYEANSTCVVSTTKGDPEGRTVGAGLIITFSLNHDPNKALRKLNSSQYEYKIAKYVYNEDADSTYVPELLEESDWFVTDSNEVLLNKFTTPSLETDFNGSGDNAEQLTYTKITGRFYALGEFSNESSIEFAVKEGFHPKTVIYPTKLYALGDNHYKDYTESWDLEDYPSLNIGGTNPVIYANRFFKDVEGRNTAVNSSNLKVYLKCGYFGQYGTMGGSVIIYSNSPYDEEIANVLNESDNRFYYSEIMGYDIRFDNEPFDFNLPTNNPKTIVTHEDGTQWRRISIDDIWSFSESLELINLSNGYHKFEVSAVDLQYVYDPTPEVFEFYLIEHIPAVNREDIMVLEASHFPTWNNSQVFADSVYQEVLSEFSGVDFYNRDEINQNTGISIEKCNLAYSDLQQYKALIYREEAQGTTFFNSDYDALKLYLNNGGNIILSSAGNLRPMNDYMVNTKKNMFKDYFGIDMEHNAINIVQTAPPKPYFIGAFPTNEIASLNNLPELNLYLGHTHNILISMRNGLNDVSYFEEDYAYPGDAFTKIIYRAKIKDIGQDNYSPTSEEEYNQWNQVPLAIGKVTNQNKCFAFGFPLSHMEKAELIQLFNQLLND